LKNKLYTFITISIHRQETIFNKKLPESWIAKQSQLFQQTIFTKSSFLHQLSKKI
jgi:hypothetical protein